MEIKKIKTSIRLRVLRNLTSINGNKSIPFQVNLEFWNGLNIGDYLSTIVYEWMMEFYHLNPNKRINKTKHLLSIGSIVGDGYFDATIWGSGIHKFVLIEKLVKRKKLRKYDIRAVRGPITRWLLNGAGYVCPEVYGDPAILMPLIYTSPVKEKKYKVSVIEHLSKTKRNPRLHYIDVKTKDYKNFINQILESEKIISSSLHGIIIAESYGVPTIFLNNGVESEIIKYYDWYLSTGRKNVKFAYSVEEALAMPPMELPKLGKMQKKLIEVFPKDLWDVS